MLSLQNFETQISRTILQRGKKYYSDGCVSDMEEISDGIYTAEVEGSEKYEVEITVKNKNKITNYFCNCPYDGDTCKHIVAILFALKENLKTKKTNTKQSPKKDSFQKLFQSIDLKEYQNFIVDYATKHKDFKTEFELYFAVKDDNIDVEKKYTELIAKIIKKHSSGGYIDYRSSFGLNKDVGGLIKTGNDYIIKENFKDAFALGCGILKPLVAVYENCDDSNGNIGANIGDAIRIFENIAHSNSVAVNIKEQLFFYLKTEIRNKIYFDYGDLGYELLSIFKLLAVQLSQYELFLSFIDGQLAYLTDKSQNYQKEFLQKIKIEFLQQIGKGKEAEKLIEQNMDIVDLRQNVVNKAIKQKDFSKAKKMIADGIKIAKGKNHSGTVIQWQKEFLRIAELESDTISIRFYAKYFAFCSGFSEEYYNQWKRTFSSAEWANIIEEYIAEVIEKTTTEWSKFKHSLWPSAHPPLLQKLGSIYVIEKFWNRLLCLLQKNNSLYETLEYQTHLIKIYPNELLAIYLPALEKYGINGNSRSDYADLVRTMVKISKDFPQSKEKILNLALKLKTQFSVKPRRPAMLEELNKILT